MAGGIVGLMSKAAGDELRKVMLNTVIAGFVTAGVVGIGIGVGTGMVRRAAVGSAQLRAEARGTEAEWARTSEEEMRKLIDARVATEEKRGVLKEDVMTEDKYVIYWENIRLENKQEAEDFKKEAAKAKEAAKKEKKHIIGDEVKVWRKAMEKFQEMRELQEERRKLIPKYAELNAIFCTVFQFADKTWKLIPEYEYAELNAEEEQQFGELKQKRFDLLIWMLNLEKATCIADMYGKTEWAKYECLTGGGDVKKLKKEAREAEAKMRDVYRLIQDIEIDLKNLDY